MIENESIILPERSSNVAYHLMHASKHTLQKFYLKKKFTKVSPNSNILIWSDDIKKIDL